LHPPARGGRWWRHPDHRSGGASVPRPTWGKRLMAADRANLRSGYTTGACAAAAAKGALLALIEQRAVADVAVRLPAGPMVTFALHTCTYTVDEGWASVIKDAGDDPDVTHRAEICVRVTRRDGPGVAFVRGEG